MIFRELPGRQFIGLAQRTLHPTDSGTEERWFGLQRLDGPGGMMFHYVEPNDAEAVKLQAMLGSAILVDVIKEVTGLKDAAFDS